MSVATTTKKGTKAAQLAATRATLHGSRLVGASTFGGPGDPGTGSTGYRGKSLTGTFSFAELGYPEGGAEGGKLGSLATGQAALVRNPETGLQAIAYKNDIGHGGGDVPYKGKTLDRSFDAWWELADYLKLKGLGALEFTPITRGQVAALKAQGIPDSPQGAASKSSQSTVGTGASTSSPSTSLIPQSTGAADIFGSDDTTHTLLYALLFLTALGLGAGLTILGVNRVLGGAPGRLTKTAITTGTTVAKAVPK